MALGRAFFGNGSGDIVLDNVVCQGTESSLLECDRNRIGQHNCDHTEDAGVRCEGTHPVIFQHGVCIIVVIISSIQVCMYLQPSIWYPIIPYNSCMY